MRVYGITGGTGSGKSAAADRFRELGIPVVDADRVGHALIGPGGAAVDAVVEAFGPGILTDGRIDRKKLGSRVFAQPEDLARLNAIVHPAIKAEIARCLAEHARQGQPLAIIDAALLAEGGKIADFVDGLVLVLAGLETRIERLMRHRGLSRDQVLQRIQAQVAPETKRPLARWVVENDGTLPALYAQVDDLARQMRAEAHRGSATE